MRHHKRPDLHTGDDLLDAAANIVDLRADHQYLHDQQHRDTYIAACLDDFHREHGCYDDGAVG